jgi:hypothetical protein
MYTSILLSVAFQEWERYSAHALAAREAAATLAQGAGTPLHVLNAWCELAKSLKRKGRFTDTQTESRLV